VTVRPLRPAQGDSLSGQAVVARLGKGMLEVQFGDASRPPVDGSDGLAGAADVIFHDGWRPPLGKPELTRTQYEAFMKDMDFGENYGLFALRFNFSVTHKVTGPKRQWVDKLMEAGIEPREMLYSTYPPQMQEFCKRIGVRYDPNDEEGTVRACIAHYRK